MTGKTKGKHRALPRFTKVDFLRTCLHIAPFLFFFVPVLQGSWDDLVELLNGNDECALQAVVLPEETSLLNWHNWPFHLAGRDRPAFAQVAVIGIPDGLTSAGSDLCASRGYMAQLIHTVASGKPKVIVIDKTYSQAACPKDLAETDRLTSDLPWVPNSGTGKLMTEVHDVLAGGTPVVVALNTEQAERVPKRSLWKRIFSKDGPHCLEDQPSIFLDEKALPFSLAYSLLDADVRAIPIRWDDPDNRDGLAMSAALAYRRHFMDALLSRANHGNLEHPVAYLPLPSKDLVRIQAPQDPESLATQEGFDKFSGRVVIIGSQNDGDRHEIAPGDFPFGYELQGRYVAALLGHAYLREWPLVTRLIVALLVTAIIERCLYVWKPRGGIHWRDLLHFFPRVRGTPDKNGPLPVYGFLSLVVCLFLTGCVASAFAGWIPPFSIVAGVLILFVFKTSEFLTSLKEDQEKQAATGAAMEARS